MTNLNPNDLQTTKAHACHRFFSSNEMLLYAGTEFKTDELENSNGT
jgi:hypothetical protein